MSENIARVVLGQPVLTDLRSSFCVGEIVGITKDGKVAVDYPGNKLGFLNARLIKGAIDSQAENTVVLLVFEGGNPAEPIIIGCLGDMVDLDSQEEPVVSLNRPQEALLDGKKVTLNATEEIVLSCGKSSITLTKDGKVVVKGKRVISRASESNKIKGSSISLN